MNIIQMPCCNKGGKFKTPPTHIVLHIMDGSLRGTDAWFNNPVASASAHFGVGKKGEIHQYVEEDRVAWHAGRIFKPTATLPPGNPNLWSLGIEHEGRAKDILPDLLYSASAELIKYLCVKYNIPLDNQHILLHREIYSKKTCPGTLDRGRIIETINKLG